MSGSDGQANALGEFLRARRAELSPGQMGLSDPGTPRRVPGLRREEVAQLASISTDYYTRLEQGRVQASAAVLETLGRALRLADDQAAYLHALAGQGAGRPRRRTLQTITPQMQRLLDELTESAAIVYGRRLDVLGWNALAGALFTDFARIPESRRNWVRIVFTDPGVRALFPDWESLGRLCVATLRMSATAFPDDPRLVSLVGELSVRNEDFRRWWAEHHVDRSDSGTKRLRHPLAGELTLDWQQLGCRSDPDQFIAIYSAPRETPSWHALRFLASWTAEAGVVAHGDGA